MSLRHKACPVVLRADHGEILAFRHPLASPQLVKGTADPGESPARAALQELREEAGIDGHLICDLGSSNAIRQGEVWHFCHILTRTLPDAWTHQSVGDDGHAYAFFWHPLAADAAGFAPFFRRAPMVIATAIG